MDGITEAEEGSADVSDQQDVASNDDDDGTYPGDVPAAAHCSICERPYDERADRAPKLLLCGHVFCASCMDDRLVEAAEAAEALAESEPGSAASAGSATSAGSLDSSLDGRRVRLSSIGATGVGLDAQRQWSSVGEASAAALEMRRGLALSCPEKDKAKCMDTRVVGPGAGEPPTSAGLPNAAIFQEAINHIMGVSTTDVLCDGCGDEDATCFCETCHVSGEKVFCDECFEQAHAMKKYRAHERRPVAQRLRAGHSECQRHPGHPLDLFCVTHAELICVSCRSTDYDGDHAGDDHTVEAVATAAAAMRVSMKERAAEMLAEEEVLRVEMSKVTASVTALDEAETLARNSVIGAMTKLHEAVDARGRNLLRMLGSIGGGKMDRLSAHRLALASALSGTHSAGLLLEHSTEETTDTALLVREPRVSGIIKRGVPMSRVSHADVHALGKVTVVLPVDVRGVIERSVSEYGALDMPPVRPMWKRRSLVLRSQAGLAKAGFTKTIQDKDQALVAQEAEHKNLKESFTEKVARLEQQLAEAQRQTLLAVTDLRNYRALHDDSAIGAIGGGTGAGDGNGDTGGDGDGDGDGDAGPGSTVAVRMANGTAWLAHIMRFYIAITDPAHPETNPESVSAASNGARVINGQSGGGGVAGASAKSVTFAATTAGTTNADIAAVGRRTGGGQDGVAPHTVMCDVSLLDGRARSAVPLAGGIVVVFRGARVFAIVKAIRSVDMPEIIRLGHESLFLSRLQVGLSRIVNAKRRGSTMPLPHGRSGGINGRGGGMAAGAAGAAGGVGAAGGTGESKEDDLESSDQKRVAEEVSAVEALRVALLGITNLAANNNDCRKAAAAGGGGIDLIVEAMREHPYDLLIQEFGCSALNSVAYRNESHAGIVSSGGVEVVLQAMQRAGSHVDGVRVQQWGAAVLHNLGKDIGLHDGGWWR